MVENFLKWWKNYRIYCFIVLFNYFYVFFTHFYSNLLIFNIYLCIGKQHTL